MCAFCFGFLPLSLVRARAVLEGQHKLTRRVPSRRRWSDSTDRLPLTSLWIDDIISLLQTMPTPNDPRTGWTPGLRGTQIDFLVAMPFLG